MYYTFYMYYADEVKLINNMIYANEPGYGHSYLFMIYYPYDITIAHNTVSFDQSVGTYNYYPFYVYMYGTTPDNVTIMNNIISQTGSTGQTNWYAVYMPYNHSYVDMRDNVWYDANNSNMQFYINTAYVTSFEDFFDEMSDDESVVADPKFADIPNYDLTPTNPAIANMCETFGLADYDVNDVMREGCGADPGALEYYMDISATNSTFSGTNECGDYSEDWMVDLGNGSSLI